MNPKIHADRLNNREQRFYKKVNKLGQIPDTVKYPDINTPCWHWIGGTYTTGYGKFYCPEKCQLAHRASYTFAFGEIPKDLWVLHRCDNPICVNPEHLFLGTNQDNVDDCIKKIRNARGLKNGICKNPELAARGESSGTAKLTNEKVIEMRNLRKQGMSHSVIASKFGVATMTAWHAIKGKTWAHITQGL